MYVDATPLKHFFSIDLLRHCSHFKMQEYWRGRGKGDNWNQAKKKKQGQSFKLPSYNDSNKVCMRESFSLARRRHVPVKMMGGVIVLSHYHRKKTKHCLIYQDTNIRAVYASFNVTESPLLSVIVNRILFVRFPFRACAWHGRAVYGRYWIR